MTYNPLPDTIKPNNHNNYQLLPENNKKSINSEKYEEYIKSNDLFTFIDLYFLNALLDDLSVIKNQRHVDRIIKNKYDIEIYSSQIRRDPKMSILSDKSIFYNGRGLKKITDMKNKITTLFENPLKYTDNKLYNLEHIEMSNNNASNKNAVLTYKNKESKIKITLNENKTIKIEKEGRGILGYKSWFSGGKSRRSKKIAKKRHTRKRRN